MISFYFPTRLGICNQFVVVVWEINPREKVWIRHSRARTGSRRAASWLPQRQEKNLFSLCPSCSAFFGPSLSRPEGADDFRICCCICFPHRVRERRELQLGTGTAAEPGLGGKPSSKVPPPRGIECEKQGGMRMAGCSMGPGALQRW